MGKMSVSSSNSASSSSSSSSFSFFLHYRITLVTFLFFTCSAYDGYREGYFSNFLPGSEEDERGIPNIPLRTDTNRYADGVTSSSYFGVVSPSFTEYVGGLAQTDNRLKYYVDYMQNARWQGLAGYLQGDARQEDARVDYLDQFDLEGIERGMEGYFNDLRTVERNFINSLFGADPGEYVLTHDVLGAQFMTDASKMTILSLFGKSPFYDKDNIIKQVSKVCNISITLVTAGTEAFPGSTTIVTVITKYSLLDPKRSSPNDYYSWVGDYYNELFNTTGTNASAANQEVPIPANPSMTFPVYAAMKWNPSNFAIQEGEKYSITATASPGAPLDAETWTDGGIRVSADGYTSAYDSLSHCYVALGRCRSYLKMRRRLPTANWMSLICSIGEFVRPVQEVLPGSEDETRFVPLDESQVQNTLFNVGLGITDFIARHNGQLICMANDAHNLYWNNAGYINVTVTRTSWPPVSETLYKDLKLPACDSAFAVYQNKGNWSFLSGCNPNGGGAGWLLEDVLRGSESSSSDSNYSSAYRRLEEFDFVEL